MKCLDEDTISACLGQILDENEEREMEQLKTLDNTLEEQVRQLFKKRLIEKDPACLNTDRIAGYVDDTLSPEEKLAVELHLRDCIYCEYEVYALRGDIILLEKGELSTPAEGILERLDNAIVDAKVALAKFVSRMQQYLPLFPRPVLQTSGKSELQSELQEGQQGGDEILRWSLIEDKSGDLIMSFGSRRMELEGVTLVVELGHLRRNETLELNRTKDSVVADFIFTEQERRELSKDSELKFDIVPQAE